MKIQSYYGELLRPRIELGTLQKQQTFNYKNIIIIIITELQMGCPPSGLNYKKWLFVWCHIHN
jgi:hypothetical protein